MSNPDVVCRDETSPKKYKLMKRILLNITGIFILIVISVSCVRNGNKKEIKKEKIKYEKKIDSVNSNRKPKGFESIHQQQWEKYRNDTVKIKNRTSIKDTVKF